MPLPKQSTPTRKTAGARRSVTEYGSPDHVALRASQIHEGTSVQDRVRQWQVQGAAFAPSPDSVSILSAPNSDAFTTLTSAQLAEECPGDDKQQDDSSEKMRCAKETGKSKPIHHSRVRSSSTPRKKVTGDDCWRSGHTQKRDVDRDQEADGPADERNPSPFSTQDSAERSIMQSRFERAERRRRRTESRSVRAQGSKDNEVDIAQVENVPVPQQILTQTRSKSGHKTSTAGDKTLPSNTSSGLHNSLSCNVDNDEILQEHDHTLRRKSKYVETLGQPLPDVSNAQLKSNKETFLNKTKGVLGITNPAPVMSARLPSIEAWLDDQPDTLSEHVASKAQFADDPPKLPRKRPVKQKASKIRTTPMDPNQIWDSIGKTTDTEQMFEQSYLAESHDASATPFSEKIETVPLVSLRRQGAKVSRQKRHTLPATLQEAMKLQENNEYQAVESATADSQPQPNNQTRPLQKSTRFSSVPYVETSQGQNLDGSKFVETEQLRSQTDLTSNENMIVALSRPLERKRARRKPRAKTTSHEDSDTRVNLILTTLAEDEAKYCRELKTLVDGVIPVLLQCLLTKSDAVAAAGLFATSTNAKNDLSFSRPIIEMGIALERLKNLHDRMPLDNADRLLSWCKSASKPYSEYLKAWRLGFQDVVIDLAPLDKANGESNDGMARDANGDIVDNEEETVDIAYLMKRPLVNIRRLGKTLDHLQVELPKNPVAAKLAEEYHELTSAAKIKHQQEKGRLEDEAAASVDTAKCRDIRTLGPLPGVTIDSNKRVRARDCFDLTLFHSSGQRMDCKVELILRDSQQESPDGGDLLICQVDESGKWLLFKSVEIGLVSARKDESDCDLVVMIRGRAGMREEWKELLALRADEPEVISEWMVMLGSNPLPPKLTRVASFIDKEPIDQTAVAVEPIMLTPSVLRTTSSIETFDVPIGEPSVLGMTTLEAHKVKSDHNVDFTDRSSSKLNMGGGLKKKEIPEHWQSQIAIHDSRPINSTSPRKTASDTSTIAGRSDKSASASASASPAMTPIAAGSLQSSAVEKSLRQGQQQSRSSQLTGAPDDRGRSDGVIHNPKACKAGTTGKSDFVSQTVSGSNMANRLVKPKQTFSPRPGEATATFETPLIPKTVAFNMNKDSGGSSRSTASTDTGRETWSIIPDADREGVSQPDVAMAHTVVQTSCRTQDEAQSKSSAQDDAHAQPVQKQNVPQQNELKYSLPFPSTDALPATQPPSPPQHKDPPHLTFGRRNTPVLRPSEAQIRMDRQNGRISYSPLRKEYTPSSASTSEDSASNLSSSDDGDSQTSDEHDSAYGVRSYPLEDAAEKPPFHTTVTQHATTPTAGTRTLAPSDSASQGPYRKVASSADRPDAVKKRAIAMICSWNDSGRWDPLIDGYCSIVVSPGLIEAFATDEGDADVAGQEQRPLAAFELTPMVPLRRPTGLDINIRSPPTPESRIQTSSNIMLRSRSAVECETLYLAIGWARSNNLTYIELQRSRPRVQPSVTFSNQQASRPRSWFSFGAGARRRNSYRVGNIPPPSLGESQASANTMSGAMSALKRLAISSSFNVNRSSIKRRPGRSKSESLYSSSYATGDTSGASTPPLSQLGIIPGKDGPNVPPTSAAAANGGGIVHNMKIKLQIRQDGGWNTLGPSRLFVLPATKREEETAGSQRADSSDLNSADSAYTPRQASGSAETQQRQYRLSSSNHTPHRQHGRGREKRVVVTAEKDHSHILLDATLGESCFEKISHLGIAVQVWRADDEVRSRGGVVMGQNTKYLFQFFHAKECAWVFDLVGKYRYSIPMTN